MRCYGEDDPFLTVKYFKSDSPQRHREHREKLFIVNSAVGAVNKVKLCALCASVVKYFDVVFELYLADFPLCQSLFVNVCFGLCIELLQGILFMCFVNISKLIGV